MYDKYIKEKNSKFIRFDVKNMTLEDLYNILKDPNFSCCFVVFKRDNYYERFRLDKPEDVISFIERIEKMLYNREDSNVDSDSFNIYEAEYIDCYPI